MWDLFTPTLRADQPVLSSSWAALCGAGRRAERRLHAREPESALITHREWEWLGDATPSDAWYWCPVEWADAVLRCDRAWRSGTSGGRAGRRAVSECVGATLPGHR